MERPAGGPGASAGAGPAAGARPLGWWLLAVCALIFAMVVVGGATRLTQSGLSIVHWKPIAGIVPPLNLADWQAEFTAYQAIPEYKLVNKGMSLAAFKAIFWWEYAHRLLGRLIGLAFALPLLFFWSRRLIPEGYGARLSLILGLGGLQGAVGWWMVASGLVERTDVSHYRLAVHLSLALALLAACQWTALDFLRRRTGNPRAGNSDWRLALLTAAALGVQIVLGAFAAGLDAGYMFNDWPRMMADAWMPPVVWEMRPWWLNLLENPAGVQFAHRCGAWAVAGLSMILAVRVWRQPDRQLAWDGVVLGLAVLLQVLLGIETLLRGVPVGLGVAHQAGGAILLMSLISLMHRLRLDMNH